MTTLLLSRAGKLILVFAASFGLLAAVKESWGYFQLSRGAYQAIRPEQTNELPPFLSSMRANDGSVVPIDTDTVLLLYSTTCSACSSNMTNWMTLVADVHRRAPAVLVAAVRLESMQKQADYWGAVSTPESVRLLSALDVGALERQIGTRLVPATIIVRHGRVVETEIGVLGPERQASVLRLLPKKEGM